MMCIAVLSNAHPHYALILISNRDEFLSRPTKTADWWDPPNSNVLGGRDLLRAEQGTWLGVSREGRIAVLTNFREEGEVKLEAHSRGELVTRFLTEKVGGSLQTEAFAGDIVANDLMKGIGGFSLVCGKVGEPLAVISNRTPDIDSVEWILGEKTATIGLSNALITDRTWTKVTKAERLLEEIIARDSASCQPTGSLVDDLFGILSDDTLPCLKEGQDWASQVKELRNSIFIPAVGGGSMSTQSAQDVAAAKTSNKVSLESPKAETIPLNRMSERYGTQKQTIVLVTKDKRLIFIERTLFDVKGQRVSSSTDNDQKFEFQVDM